ncbi:MAG: HAMP domain-containing histidine kinase [Alphaproteobacteria bacterium]|nr:HAMP domain-containing histidine kinase [Alphaproteobacteria bacterium]
MLQKIEQIVDLRKKDVPLITIYGDDGDYEFTQFIWGLIPGFDVAVVSPKNTEDLIMHAYNSALIFILIGEGQDEQIYSELAQKLAQTEGIVADVIAMTAHPDIRARLHILSNRFDAIYNLKIVGRQEFPKIFNHKLSKGMMRLASRKQEDEYRAFLGYLSVSADAFIVFDSLKRIFYVSPQYQLLFSKGREMLVRGQHAQKMFDAMILETGLQPQNEEFDRIFNFWNKLSGELEICLESTELQDSHPTLEDSPPQLQNHEIQSSDAQLDHGDGVKNYYRLTATNLTDGEGILVSLTNITSYKQQEHQLARQQQQLSRALAAEQEASSLQKQFISMVSHEFRNPLAIIDGNAQLIEKFGEKITGGELKQRLKTIRAAVSRTIGMMETLLSSNLLRTGKLDLNREIFNLPDLIRDICEEQANLSSGHMILVQNESVHEDVCLDKKFMTIIITNLLSNALKFTPTQGGQVVIKLSEKQQNDQLFIEIAVQDNGRGIPSSDMAHIFQKFFRASNATGIAGSGVGLSLVRDLVHLHKGEIFVESQLNQGTIFTAIFPRNYSASESRGA